MSDYTEALSRDYIHSVCKGVTTVSGDDYVMIECPFRRVTHTYCTGCNQTVPLSEVTWVDSGQRISDYRKEIADGVSFWERLRLTVLGTTYEGALRLHLDPKGNPTPEAKPLSLKSKSLADDHQAVVGAMQELTSALMEEVPPHIARIRCDVGAVAPGEEGPIPYSVTNPARPSEGLQNRIPRVDQAIARLVRVMNPSRGPFPGLVVNMERKSDGRWHNLIELVQG
jgi:hypothetical protein